MTDEQERYEQRRKLTEWQPGDPRVLTLLEQEPPLSFARIALKSGLGMKRLRGALLRLACRMPWEDPR